MSIDTPYLIHDVSPMTPSILGKTGLRVSPICIGTWQLAGPLTLDGKPDGHPDPGKAQVIRLIQALHDRGINFIDTAEQYGNGEAERRTGEALAGHREEWIISTKFGYRVGPGNTRIDDASPATILPSLEGSLKRLQTEVIDVFLYHCPPQVEDLPEAKAILDRAKAQGKIRFYGISTGNPALARILAEHDMLDVLQFPTNLLAPNDAMRALANEYQVGTQVRGIMAEGRLSGKYQTHTPAWSPDDRRSQNPETFAVPAATLQALPEGWTLDQFAVRWALDQPGHHSICLGAKTLEDYERAIAVKTL
ncbi:MAG: aryl-alcohol dehydrogenase-like predicted oxidoreductase [Candidatus Omnitrophota bacterium]|jgi:aryl-alcohol dehydrogenase-like predicted oxidoreductase